MEKSLDKVRQFHAQIGAPISSSPTLLRCRPEVATKVSERIRQLVKLCQELTQDIGDLPCRLSLEFEELAEWAEAHAAGDLVAAADAWGDRMYVLLGDAVTAGLPAAEIFDEIHRSNMTKSPTMRGSAKGTKGPGFLRTEISNIIDEVSREGTAMNFVAQLTSDERLPDPVLELDRIVAQTEPRDDEVPEDDQPERDYAWFATNRGQQWSYGPGAKCMAFVRLSNGEIDAVEAQIIERSKTVPQDPLVRDFYNHFHFPYWWKVRDVRRRRFKSIDNLPGRHVRTGRSAAETFSGNCSFAYWNFDDGRFTDLNERESDVELSLPSQQQPPHDVSRGSDRATLDLVPRGLLLHGVDFSGCREDGRGNCKIWISRWDTDRNEISLLNGRNDDFRRADLPKMIVEGGGWWIFDFPFGIAAETAASLRVPVTTWNEWLEFCHGDGFRQCDYATQRRDTARDAVMANGVRWSIRRQVDDSHGTTWFPLFQQLYRQTITGAAEVLYPLRSEQYCDRVCVLPWDTPDPGRAYVVEGFPGLVLVRKLGLPATGYKGRKNGHQSQRECIVNRLRDKLPLTEETARQAIDDSEGDALDSLLLLLAAADCARLPPENWQIERDRLKQDGKELEGWFPA